MSSNKACNLFDLKEKEVVTKSSNVFRFIYFIFLLSLVLVFFCSTIYNNTSYFPTIVDIAISPKNTNVTMNNNYVTNVDYCIGKYIYIQDLPGEFNQDILKNCSEWENMCDLVANSGLGLHMNNDSSHEVFSSSGWFFTNQFVLDVIFHNKMKQYKCLTNDSSKASAIFVPFYTGLDAGKYQLNGDATLRDAASIKLAKYLKQTPEWNTMMGRDHFVVAGRIAWDFMRYTEDSSGWGNRFLFIPEVRNMTSLVLENDGSSDCEVAVPYPTYFHPSTDAEVFNWQHKMRQQQRPYLFSFAGGPRPNENRYVMRNEIISQCVGSSNYCEFVRCDSSRNCENPETVMRLFQSSVFCLQPLGDSQTRRSAFDSIIAGCIPVFFNPSSAYDQYVWHLPKNYTSYSVLIPAEEVLRGGNGTIEKRLLEIPKEEIMAMREQVIRLIPNVIYANPNSRLERVEDAFDIIVKGVLKRIEKVRVGMKV